jgi:ribosomal protein L37AE/L43A
MKTFTSFLPLALLVGALLASGCVPESRYGPRYGDRYRYGGGSYQPAQRQTLTCESRGGKSEYCPTGRRGDVRLARQLSDAPCREHDTWGTDRDGGGIWVDRGCRAIFSVAG